MGDSLSGTDCAAGHELRAGERLADIPFAEAHVFSPFDDPPQHRPAVPTDVDSTDNGVAFVISPNVDPKVIDVQATILNSSGTKFFGRLKAELAP